MRLILFAKIKALSLSENVSKIDPKYIAWSLWVRRYEQASRIEMGVEHNIGLILIFILYQPILVYVGLITSDDVYDYSYFKPPSEDNERLLGSRRCK